MDQAEVARLIDWAAGETWNPGLEDASTFWASDNEGFLGIELGGQLAGGGSVVKHNLHYGFMGLFILQPEFRGRGLGKQLWFARRDRLLNRLSPNGCIGLDALAHMIPFYSRGGFRPAHRIQRFLAPTGLSAGRPTNSTTPGELVPLSLHDVDEISTLDTPCFPGLRNNYLHAWLAQPRARVVGYRERTHLRGYTVMRPCRLGWKIGPMFCHSPTVADALLTHCLQHAGSDSVSIDVPEANVEANHLVEHYGMRPVFECTRMFLGPMPDMHLPWIYGITTFELG